MPEENTDPENANAEGEDASDLSVNDLPQSGNIGSRELCSGCGQAISAGRIKSEYRTRPQNTDETNFRERKFAYLSAQASESLLQLKENLRCNNKHLVNILLLEWAEKNIPVDLDRLRELEREARQKSIPGGPSSGSKRSIKKAKGVDPDFLKTAFPELDAFADEVITERYQRYRDSVRDYEHNIEATEEELEVIKSNIEDAEKRSGEFAERLLDVLRDELDAKKGDHDEMRGRWVSYIQLGGEYPFAEEEEALSVKVVEPVEEPPAKVKKGPKVEAVKKAAEEAAEATAEVVEEPEPEPEPEPEVEEEPQMVQYSKRALRRKDNREAAAKQYGISLDGLKRDEAVEAILTAQARWLEQLNEA